MSVICKNVYSRGKSTSVYFSRYLWLFTGCVSDVVGGNGKLT